MGGLFGEGLMSFMIRSNKMRSRIFCSAALLACVTAASSCATSQQTAVDEFGAYGYLTPGPTSEPELIGIYASKKECREAADDWEGRQVVGNPIFAECYPVDKN